MAAPVSIVIPAFNQLEYCRGCVASVLENTAPPYKLILVDNGSTDGVGAFFDTFPNACVIHAGTNRGFAGGVNLGLAEAEGHALLLNSDTLVPRGWLDRLVNALESSPDIGMVGPRSNCVSGAQQIDGLAFTGLEEINVYAESRAEQCRGRLQDTDRLVGFCLLIRDRVVREVGPFDEGFGPGNYEDDDYCLRVRMAGYRLCIADDAFVFHYGSRTFAGMDLVGEKWRALMERNRRRFIGKWTRDQRDAERSRELNGEARAAFERGDTRGALDLLRQALEADPLFAGNYNDVGALLWELGERERAWDYFVRALRLDPRQEEARRNLRDAALVLERQAEAQALLDEE